MSAHGFMQPPAQELRHCTHSRIRVCSSTIEIAIYSSNTASPLLSDIRNANDAHRIFEAVRLGLLPLITRRLTPTERDLLRSGQVFVWEEGSSSGGGAEDGTPSAGLERWTDGRRWYVQMNVFMILLHPALPRPTDKRSRSQSRMREPFLFYEEKIQTTQEEKHQKAIRRARKASTASDSNPTAYDLPIRRQDRPSKPDGLTKQTYSCKSLFLFPVGAAFSPSYPDTDRVPSPSTFDTLFRTVVHHLDRHWLRLIPWILPVHALCALSHRTGILRIYPLGRRTWVPAAHMNCLPVTRSGASRFVRWLARGRLAGFPDATLVCGLAIRQPGTLFVYTTVF